MVKYNLMSILNFHKLIDFFLNVRISVCVCVQSFSGVRALIVFNCGHIVKSYNLIELLSNAL